MAYATKAGICPTHGLVEARRKTTYDRLGWLVALLSAFQWSPDTPYRCPKCGALTTEPGEPD